ncbi:MAG: cyclic nucleotide-binding domain-containing protein [Candidatus Methanofishera endochildressiae]|uniref:Cyclic nucleotide-binding domain-containing protein n=1 Tax=Candidatus Methanofishera endochildressiae TaxID=2738884 RepID=A0A7Z0MNW8_9GAMM|nr:cyclic nucleotide-binding domain-containing protein [Candidatus Methanofishera endochildressiae]
MVAGNCFGEYSLLDGHYVSATVETLENTRILIIDKHDFQKIMDNVLFIAKTVYYNLARLYISRLRKNAGSRYFCESLFWASQPKQAAKT